MTVREARPTDVQAIAAAERMYIDCPWTEKQVADEISSGGAVFLVAEDEYGLAGYVSGAIADVECEMSNIAVSERYRRQGVGSMLMSELVRRLKQRGVDSVFLLVRSDNLPAIGLYKKTGFCEVGRRRDYYKSGDALIMRLNI